MNRNPVEVLTDLSREFDVGLQTHGEAQVLRFQKDEVDIEVTIPNDVLEWFINASAVNDVAATRWWCDYTGYDDTPHEELVSTMASDIRMIVCGLLARQIRLSKRPSSLFSKILRFPARYQLDWLIGGRWEEALS